VKKAALLFLILLLPSIAYFVLTTGRHHIKQLGYFGPKIPGEKAGDTLYHKIPEFAFTDENGKPFGSKELENKIYVANFFFTSCPTICPEMQTLLKKVHDVDDFEKLEDLRFVSFTVDPKTDTPEKLKEYSSLISADPKRWHFLTGDMEKIYEIAGPKGFMINAMEDSTAECGFLHSELMILVDREKHIRGIYEGRDVMDNKRLIDEIKVLVAEYNLALKGNTNPIK